MLFYKKLLLLAIFLFYYYWNNLLFIGTTRRGVQKRREFWVSMERTIGAGGFCGRSDLGQCKEEPLFLASLLSSETRKIVVGMATWLVDLLPSWPAD